MTPAFTPDIPQQRQKPSAACGSVSVFWWSWLWRSYCLPSVVSEYELPLERRIEKPLSQSLPRRLSRRPRFPVRGGAAVHRRKQAQDVLAELLEKQGQLDALEVASWGKQTMTPRWVHPSVMSITGRKILSSP